VEPTKTGPDQLGELSVIVTAANCTNGGRPRLDFSEFQTELIITATVAASRARSIGAETGRQLEDPGPASAGARGVQAQIYGALGDKDRAFQWLEKSTRGVKRSCLFLKVDPLRSAALRPPVRGFSAPDAAFGVISRAGVEAIHTRRRGKPTFCLTVAESLSRHLYSHFTVQTGIGGAIDLSHTHRTQFISRIS